MDYADRKALADRFVGLLAEWANANEDWKDAYDWADEPEMHAAALEKERIQGEIIAAATALREEGELSVGMSQLHRYLTDAYKRGADHQRDGDVPDDYELRIAEAEGWAREYVDLRLENGLIRHPHTEEPEADE